MKKLFLLYTQRIHIKSYKKDIGLFAFMLSIIVGLSFPAEAKEDLVWKQGADYVGLEQAKKGEVNDHPVEFDASQIYQIMRNIRVQKEHSGLFDLKIFDSKDDYSNEMFSRDELIGLSQNISRGLKNASASQDVVFSITGSHEKTLGTSSSTTTGRVFYSAGKLNLIIGQFRVDLAQKYRRQGGHSDVSETIDRDKLEGFKLDTGNRRKSLKPEFVFLEDEYQTLHETAKGDRRKDWLEIDVENAIASYSEPKSTQAVGNTKRVDNEQKDYKKLENKMEQLEQRLEQKETQNTMVTTHNKPKASIEQRLTDLKTLFSKGLIDEDSYNKKMKNILDEL